MTTSTLSPTAALSASLEALLASGRAKLQAEADQAQRDQDRADAKDAELQERVRALFHPGLRDYITLGAAYEYGRASASLEIPNACRISFLVAFTDTDAKIVCRRNSHGLFSVWPSTSEFPIEETDDLGRAVAIAVREYVPPAPPKPPSPPAVDWLAVAVRHLDKSAGSTFCADGEVLALRAIAAGVIALVERVRIED